MFRDKELSNYSNRVPSSGDIPTYFGEGFSRENLHLEREIESELKNPKQDYWIIFKLFLKSVMCIIFKVFALEIGLK